MNDKYLTDRLKYVKKISNSWIFKWYMWNRLPSIGFWGVRLNQLEEECCKIGIRYRWSNQNPFKSIYFSALNGAAELSTGLLVQMHLQGRGQWSMLVTHFSADFSKKAIGNIEFISNDGKVLLNLIDKIEKENLGSGTIVLNTQGFNEQGVIVMEANITWSLRKK